MFDLRKKHKLIIDASPNDQGHQGVLASDRGVLDRLPVGAALCAPGDLELLFVNARGRALLGEAAQGQPIDQLHPDLAGPAARWARGEGLSAQVEVILLGRHLQLGASVWASEAGASAGYDEGSPLLLLIRPVDREVNIRAERDQLRAMLDQMPVNVMACDRDTWRIDYLNTTSVETLRRIEQHLPVCADAMLGTSIDVFHKHPDHQQRMLADPANLPHRARIKVGPEVLDLSVTAVRDSQGAYLFPMVTWDLRTDIERVSDQFRRDVTGVVDTVGDNARAIDAGVSVLLDSTGNIATRVDAVSKAMAATTSSIQTAASAAEHLTNAISTITTQVDRSSAMARDASAAAEETAAIVTSLNEAAGRIGRVVDMINDVADRTNLLALNATIEAARAGEAGRGFAVVATEVKSLANQTARSTQEIAQQVIAIQKATGASVDAIGRIRSIITELSGATHAITGSVSDQGEASRTITDSIQQSVAATATVARHLSEVEGITTAVSGSVRGFASQSQVLTGAVAALDEQAARFLVAVEAL